MRTLKKALCVVLCLVMMAGLCVIGTSAAFTDADKINYKEAVDVLSGIGVINGMGDGTFAPQGTLTRAQACKIIVYLLKEEDLKGTCNFADCKGHWAANEIAICEAKGIVAGYGNGNFGPDDPLTGAAFAKMLLCALGYNAVSEGMTGDSWELGVATLVKKVKLAEGIKGFDGTAPITREEACQLAFNALFIEEVGYANGGTTITAGDVTITTGASAAQGLGEYLKYLFGLNDTTDDTAPDSYGHEAVQQWKAGKKVIYTEYQEADWTYANKTGAAVSAAKVKAAYAKEAGLKESAVKVLWDDGSDFDATVYPGDTYEFAASADGKTLTVIAGYCYVPALVKSVKDTADKDVDYTKDIELDIETVHDDELTIGVKKGDWIAVPYTGSDYIYADAVVMEGANGVMSAYNASAGTATIGGKKLAIANAIKDVDGAVYGKDFKSTLTYYTDPNGMLLVAEVYEEAFAYETEIGYALYKQSRAYAGGSASDLLGGGGAAAKEGRAVWQILGMDGKVTTFDIAVKQDAKNEKTTYIGKDSKLTGEVADEGKAAVNKFVEYYTNDDGTIVIVDIIDATSITTAKASYQVAGQKANSNTVIHIVNKKDASGNYATSTIKGYKNFKDATYGTAYMVVDKGYITDIYAVEVDAGSTVVALPLGYCQAIGDETADGTEVTFIVDGKEASYVQETLTVAKGGYYELEVDGTKIEKATAKAPNYDDAKIATVDDGFIDTDKGLIEFAKTTNIYDISGKSLTLATDVIVAVFEQADGSMILFIVGKA